MKSAWNTPDFRWNCQISWLKTFKSDNSRKKEFKKKRLHFHSVQGEAMLYELCEICRISWNPVDFVTKDHLPGLVKPMLIIMLCTVLCYVILLCTLHCTLIIVKSKSVILNDCSDAKICSQVYIVSNKVFHISTMAPFSQFHSVTEDCTWMGDQSMCLFKIVALRKWWQAGPK